MPDEVYGTKTASEDSWRNILFSGINKYLVIILIILIAIVIGQLVYGYYSNKKSAITPTAPATTGFINQLKSKPQSYLDKFPKLHENRIVAKVLRINSLNYPGQFDIEIETIGSTGKKERGFLIYQTSFLQRIGLYELANSINVGDELYITEYSDFSKAPPNDIVALEINRGTKPKESTLPYNFYTFNKIKSQLKPSSISTYSTTFSGIITKVDLKETHPFISITIKQDEGGKTKSNETFEYSGKILEKIKAWQTKVGYKPLWLNGLKIGDHIRIRETNDYSKNYPQSIKAVFIIVLPR